jgi:hypothetical protein
VLGTVSVLRLPTDADVRDDCVSGNGELFDRLSAGRVVASGGDPARRSSIEPQWLTARDGSACGLLADTAAAKRLVADDGVELRSAHLGRFAWTSADGAAAVVWAERSPTPSCQPLGGAPPSWGFPRCSSPCRAGACRSPCRRARPSPARPCTA